MEQKAVNTAPIKWAQRSDCLYLTVDLHVRMCTGWWRNGGECSEGRRDVCYFLVFGISNESVSLTETEMHFRGDSEGKYFEAHLEFYKPIVPDKCKWKNHPLGLEVYIEKKEDEKKKEGKEEKNKEGKGLFWPHLLKDKSLEKLNTVTVDWNHYVDSDEEDEKETGFDWSRY